VTSRRPLGVPGERLITVPPLPLESSLRLFEDRAAAIDPDFALTPLTIQAVTELCRRLDGLPLAIELAAARLRSLSVVELLDRLDDRFGLLAGVSRTALKRHRGLRAALEWSHELCDPRQRRLWARLSVFPGEFGLREAEAVCAGEELPAHTIGPVLADLVEGSIVIRDGARHRLLESFRELGALRLLEYGEADAVRARHRELPTDEGTWPRTPRPVWEGGPGLLMPGISESPLPLPISGTLSHRQREVAELITEGLSNPKIAERLMIAKRTVDAHVRNILVKGGLTSRTQVATWMVADSDLSNDSGSLA
jgi:DNA-binding CsgD family transcriptional regulator